MTNEEKHNVSAFGPPRFIKYNSFNRLAAKPSGNMVRLKCPAEGLSIKFNFQNLERNKFPQL